MKKIIIIIILGTVSFLLGTIPFILYLTYIQYQLFKGVILWNKAGNTTKVIRNIAISAVIFFPIAIVEMFYILIESQKKAL